MKYPFGMVDTLFQISVWWVTIYDWPFSVGRHNLLYTKMLRECPSIFSAEGDATLHDSCLDTTVLISSVQNRCERDGIISCFQERVLLTFSSTCICLLGKIPIFPHLTHFGLSKSATFFPFFRFRWKHSQIKCRCQSYKIYFVVTDEPSQ